VIVSVNFIAAGLVSNVRQTDFKLFQYLHSSVLYDVKVSLKILGLYVALLSDEAKKQSAS